MNKKKKYKGVSVNLFGLPDVDLYENKKIVKRIYLDSFATDFKENAPKNLILMYDIPDNMKKHRDWFRRQLKSFGFIMVQKSVWVGPSPLPKDFLEYLKEIKIGDKFKTFKLAKAYKF
ncbi:MAG: CRISPR-associated endonuclease Cas2 [Candidatus Nomurabacteria bacterium]|nr:CRISPR-associated endonuclease Cas2 [Candidatus Nomurabacteria bacterium]